MRKSFLVLLTLVLTTSAFALNIKQRKKLAYWIGEVEKYQGTVVKKCGMKIPTTIDEAMVAPFLEKNKSVSGYCKSIMDGVMAVCESSDAEIKKYVMTKIKDIKCLHGGDSKKLDLKITGTTLEAKIGMNAANIWKETHKWIENNL